MIQYNENHSEPEQDKKNVFNLEKSNKLKTTALACIETRDKSS